MNQELKNCQSCKNQFCIEPEDFEFYAKIKVPPPTWCPECRMVRRFLFRNERFLFRKKEEAEGKEIFSSFPSDAPVKIYERDYWWQDAWNPLECGRPYDFSRPFFDQFRELLASVPLFAKSVVNMVNSEYCDQAGWVKNSYLCFDGGEIEDSAYLVKVDRIKDSFDLYEAMHVESCYETTMSDDCYRAFFSFDCENCSEILFSKDCTGCSNCFGCVNLRNKSYYIFNESYTKEEYFTKIKEFDLGSYRNLQTAHEKSQAFWSKFPVKYMHGFQNVNSKGEHIQNSKNVKKSFSVHDCENISYSQMIWDKATDSYDFTNFGLTSSRVYESVTCGLQSYGLRFCWECWSGSRDLEYSAFCPSSANLFGCVGLKKKEYCILNTQYTKEEFGILREKIVAHMGEMPYRDQRGRIYRYGEFFPPEFSPFAYNETLAHDFFPLAKAEAEEKGYIWRETKPREYQTKIKAEDLPDSVHDSNDSITKEMIQCMLCGKPYQIIPMEFDFYKKMELPLPRLCPNCRFLKRFTLINPPKFWQRKCQCAGESDKGSVYKNTTSHFHGAAYCPNEFETSYASERSEIVYCEQCYNSEVT